MEKARMQYCDNCKNQMTEILGAVRVNAIQAKHYRILQKKLKLKKSEVFRKALQIMVLNLARATGDPEYLELVAEIKENFGPHNSIDQLIFNEANKL